MAGNIMGFVLPYMRLCVYYDKMGCPDRHSYHKKAMELNQKIQEYCMTRNISGKNMIQHKKERHIYYIFLAEVQACGDLCTGKEAVVHIL